MTDLLGSLHRHDERLLHFIVGRRYHVVDTLMRRVTHIADPLPATLAALVLASMPATHSTGRIGLFALIISHLWVQILKRSFGRRRPALPYGIESLIDAPDRFSFPSGHSAAAASLALTLAIALPAAALPIVMVAILIGASRCYLGVHYPGDVLVGWILAGLAFALGAAVLPI